MKETVTIIAANRPLRNRSPEYDWLRKNRDLYDGQYVALKGGELIARGSSAKEVFDEARLKGVEDALIVFVEA